MIKDVGTLLGGIIMDKKYPSRSEYRRSHSLKKPFYRKWWFWLIIILLIIGGGAGYYLYSNQQKNTPSVQTKKDVSKKQPQKKKKSKNNSAITLKQYNGTYISDKDGLSLDILTKLFGKPATSSVSKVDDKQTNMETWNNIAGGNKNSKLVIQFYNDHAIEKTISDLKVNRTSKISLIDYAKIDNDQSIDQVIQVLGKPNYYSETNLNGTTTITYKYTTGLKGDDGASCTVNLINGKVSGKSQTGLK